MLSRLLCLIPFYYRFAAARNIRRVMPTELSEIGCGHYGTQPGDTCHDCGRPC